MGITGTISAPYARNRNYSPSLGMWISQDPLQYVNGANTYQMEISGPVGAVDPGGLAGHTLSGWIPGAPIGGVPQPNWYNPATGQTYFRYPGMSPYPPGRRPYTPPQAGWPGALDNFFTWVGGHSGTTTYGPNSPYSQQMSQSTVGQSLVQFFLNKNKGKPCDKWVGVTDYAGRFGPLDYVENLFNGTAEFVGSATGSVQIISVSHSGGHTSVAAEFKLKNVTSLKSFLLHISPNSWNVTTQGSPFSNWTQYYEWRETFPCRCEPASQN